MTGLKLLGFPLRWTPLSGASIAGNQLCWFTRTTNAASAAIF